MREKLLTELKSWTHISPLSNSISRHLFKRNQSIFRKEFIQDFSCQILQHSFQTVHETSTLNKDNRLTYWSTLIKWDTPRSEKELIPAIHKNLDESEKTLHWLKWARRRRIHMWDSFTWISTRGKCNRHLVSLP